MKLTRLLLVLFFATLLAFGQQATASVTDYQTWLKSWQPQRAEAETAFKEVMEANQKVEANYRELKKSLRCLTCRLFPTRDRLLGRAKKVKTRLEELRASMDARYRVEGQFQTTLTYAMLHAYGYSDMSGITNPERQQRLDAFERWTRPLEAKAKLRLVDWGTTMEEVRYCYAEIESALYKAAYAPSWLTFR